MKDHDHIHIDIKCILSYTNKKSTCIQQTIVQIQVQLNFEIGKMTKKQELLMQSHTAPP